MQGTDTGEEVIEFFTTLKVHIMNLGYSGPAAWTQAHTGRGILESVNDDRELLVNLGTDKVTEDWLYNYASRNNVREIVRNYFSGEVNPGWVKTICEAWNIL
jgi:hypothetical protein